MKTFKATLYVNGVEIDYMEFETDTERAATKYAVSRFIKAYPQYPVNRITVQEVK